MNKLLEWLTASTKASGVPLHVQDKNVIRRLAQLLK